MTGWSRFTHHTVLCELLPHSIPSLVLCLSVVERRKLNMSAIYGSIVKILMLQGRIILQSLDDILQECGGDLKRFADILPKVKSKDECFCSDAFEIGWTQEKVVFLVTKMKDLCRDWLSIDHQKSNKTLPPPLIRDTDSMELDSEVDSY